MGIFGGIADVFKSVEKPVVSAARDVWQGAQPFIPAALDIAGVATGNPELGALASGTYSAGHQLGQEGGGSLSDALRAGVTTGGEAFAGNEVAGALTGGDNGLTQLLSSAGIDPSSLDLSGLISGVGTNIEGGINNASNYLGLGDTFSPTSGALDNMPGATSATDVSGGYDTLGGGAGGDTLTGSYDPTLQFGGDTSTTLPTGSTVPSSLPNANGASDFGNAGAANTLGFNAPAGATSLDSSISGLDNASASPVANATSGSGNSIANLFKKPSLPNLGAAISNNASSIPSVAGLGLSALNASKTLPGQDAIKAEASQLGTQGADLQKYLQSGTLPPGAQASLNQAAQAAKASIKSQYAARGMSGSSAEAQDLAAVDSQTSTQGFNMASQLLQQGISETGLASELYTNLMKQALGQDQQLQQALTGFGSSLVNTGGKQVTLNLG